MNIIDSITKNIIFHIDDMNDLENWLKSLVSDIYLHLKNDMKDYNPGIYQIAWTINTLEKPDGEQHAIEEGK